MNLILGESLKMFPDSVLNPQTLQESPRTAEGGVCVCVYICIYKKIYKILHITRLAVDLDENKPYTKTSTR